MENKSNPSGDGHFYSRPRAILGSTRYVLHSVFLHFYLVSTTVVSSVHAPRGVRLLFKKTLSRGEQIGRGNFVKTKQKNPRGENTPGGFHKKNSALDVAATDSCVARFPAAAYHALNNKDRRLSI